MIRCRLCNSELSGQVRFCNVCGLPQNPQEPKRENSTQNREKALETNSSSHCENCGADIQKEARFCAVCGTAQISKKSSTFETTLNENIPIPRTKNNEGSPVYVRPSVLIKPAQTIKTVNQQQSKASENASVRPKTVTHPPVFPLRPTSNSVKPSSPQQPITPIPESSSEPQVASTQIKQSNQKKILEKAVSAVLPQNSVFVQDDRRSDISIQTPEELSTPTRAPGLIGPVTSQSSTRSVIPTRSDSNGQALSSPQPTQIARTPEYQISSPINNQAQPNSNPAFMHPEAGNQNKLQIAQKATERMPVYPQPTINVPSPQNHVQEPIAGAQRTVVDPTWQHSSTYDSVELSSRSPVIERINGNNGVSDTPTLDLLNPASFMSTSKAAEQWHKSWRDRQYAEAGPAENISRGQASVPAPLTPMHQSLVRMRTIQKDDKKQQGKRSIKLSSWITIFLMICLIIGLGVYILISYMPNSPFGVRSVTPPLNSTQPTLALVGTSSQTVTVGQSIQLHGKHFGFNQAIILLRDTATPIADKNGNNISTHTDNRGAFDVTISIDSNWSVGSHSIEAFDKSSSQNAFQTIEVIPARTAISNSTELSITMQGKPVSLLTFKTVIGQGNPDPQEINIINTSASPLKWTATTSTNNNSNWLMINDNNNYGQLAISQPHSILISVNTVGLKTTNIKHPYQGQIIFTINNTRLLTLPVQLQIVDATPEMVFSPNPIIAPIGSGNTCQPDVTLTLINLGTAAISWAVNPDIKDKIKFVSNGQLLEAGTLLPSGSLLPSGQPGDTVVLTLQCNNVQIGQHYTIRVYANQLSWSDSVSVVRQQS